MPTIQRQYLCPVISQKVIITVQTHVIGGIGETADFLQKDYGCHEECQCQHRYTQICPVRQKEA